MAVTTSGGLKNDNALILNSIRNNASMEYRSRIPAATQANIQLVAESLFNFKPAWNEFIGALVNRIGEVVVRDMTWSNPLAEFKRGMLAWGDTIEEIQVGLIQAKIYDPDREYLEKEIFGTNRPDVQSNFHTINRANYYPITVNEALLKRAFLDGGGLSGFVSQLLQAPVNSDQVDEFLVTTALFSTYERNGGFYHVNVPDVKNMDSTGDDARRALRKVRAMAENLQFPSTAYNAAHMPSFANADELVLFATPEYRAAVDVEALAGAFNLDKVETSQRVITIPEQHFNIPGCQAILTTKDFFVIADTVLENTNAQNPVALAQNYFLHHQQIVSASRFVPAVMFHTGADDEVININMKPTAVSVIKITDHEGAAVAAAGSVNRGALYQFDADVTTDAVGGSQALIWSVSGHTSSRTTISSTGVLKVGWDEAGVTLTITAKTAGFDSENLRADAKTATITVKPAGLIQPPWPAVGKLESISYDGILVPVVLGTDAYDVTIADTKADVEKLKIVEDGGLSVSAKAAGAKITIKIDPAYGTAERTIVLTLKAPVA